MTIFLIQQQYTTKQETLLDDDTVSTLTHRRHRQLEFELDRPTIEFCCASSSYSAARNSS